MWLLDNCISFLSSLTSWQYPLMLGIFLLVVSNSKVLVFAWHIRIFYGYFRHYYFNTKPFPTTVPGNLIVFQPTVYSSRTALFELDYNLHKSNSTYLTDLDVARGYHVYTIFRTGINKYSSKTPPAIVIPEFINSTASTKVGSGSKTRSKPGYFYPALGGVTCTFKREIGPYQSYEVWTRVLSWDNKWIYLISHFVKPSSRHPSAYSSQPRRTSDTNFQKTNSPEANKTSANVFAFFISKYAFKQGRITIPPATFLQNCELLPTDAQAEGEKGREIWDAISTLR